jgi:hypothetical protein
VAIATSFLFAISIAIYAGPIVIFVILALCSRFRIEPVEGVKTGVLYLLFIIASTVIIAINICLPLDFLNNPFHLSIAREINQKKSQTCLNVLNVDNK